MTDTSEDQEREPMHSYIGLRAFELTLARDATHAQGIGEWVRAEQDWMPLEGDAVPATIARYGQQFVPRPRRPRRLLSRV